MKEKTIIENKKKGYRVIKVTDDDGQHYISVVYKHAKYADYLMTDAFMKQIGFGGGVKEAVYLAGGTEDEVKEAALILAGKWMRINADGSITDSPWNDVGEDYLKKQNETGELQAAIEGNSSMTVEYQHSIRSKNFRS